MTPESFDSTVGHLLRELAPQVLGAVARRHGDFAAAEDAVQESLVAAASQLWAEWAFVPPPDAELGVERAERLGAEQRRTTPPPGEQEPS